MNPVVQELRSMMHHSTTPSWANRAADEIERLEHEALDRKAIIDDALTDRCNQLAARVAELEQQRYELQARLDRLLVSVDSAANWIRNCSTPLDAACELEMAAAKERGKA